MSYLVLDLDLTAIVCEFDEDIFDNQFHLRSPTTLYAKFETKDLPVSFKIINPKKLGEIIELACTKHDGIIVLTAGCWDPSIIKTIAEELYASKHISEEAKENLLGSAFHSAGTDCPYFEEPGLSKIQNMAKIQQLPKNFRLQKIIEMDPKKYKGKYFVMLDDNIHHLESCSSMENVYKVLATTMKSTFKPGTPIEARWKFYEQAKVYLNTASTMEKSESRFANGVTFTPGPRASLAASSPAPAPLPAPQPERNYSDMVYDSLVNFGKSWMHYFFQPKVVVVPNHVQVNAHALNTRMDTNKQP